MEIPCEATSVEGFVCLTVQLITHGYHFYVTGDTRNDRNLTPHEIDMRMVRKFDANLPRWQRSRRKAKGLCNVRYVRYGKDWVLFSTAGSGAFFDCHKAGHPGGNHDFKDIREVALKFHGYAISLSNRGFAKKTNAEKDEYRQAKKRQIDARRHGVSVTLPRGKRHRRWVGRVCITRDRYEGLRAEALGLATHRSAAYLRTWFYNQPFLPYAPVRWQLRTILREVNKSRRHVGYTAVPDDSIRFFMRHVPAFDDVE
jgi:hypothetical protein